MKQLMMCFFVMSFSSFAFAQKDVHKGTIKVRKDSVYTKPEKMPEFPGGQQAMYNFINTNIVYPDSAKNNLLSGTCFITFIINTDGAISDIKVLKGATGCWECDIEAMRVIRSMPAWSSGKNKGELVRTQLNIPIKFTLK